MLEDEKKEKEQAGKLSRREFLKDAGLVVGGATIGSMAILSACSSGGGETTKTVTQTVTKTSTATAAGGTATVTVTSPPVTKVVESSVEGLTTLIVNGRTTVMRLRANWSLAYVLREKLGLTGTKIGCNSGDCGVCTVQLDGRPVLSCLTLAVEADNKKVTTVEGLAGVGSLDPLQQAFIDYDGMQCGFCTAGQLMTAKALLAVKPKPTEDEIKEFMSGALCRCGAQPGIIQAIQAVGK